MSMSAHQLQLMFARRREAEHARTERTTAVQRYYDHWGQVTHRYQNWTNPQYYEQADAQLRKNKEKKEKAEMLIERREKLTKLFKEEQSQYDAEVKNLQRCKPRSRQHVDIDTLEKIAQQAKERQDIKRKLELEARLYGQWRHGVSDENLIFDSKSDHQVLAKLNWLDKKVDEEMQREKAEIEAQERQLKSQEEQRKLEEIKMEREKTRAMEVKDVQTLQEQHMEALKQRHQESSELREEEKKLRAYVQELAKERELLDESSRYVREPPEIAQAFNVKKIKVLMRNRAETFRNQLKLTVNILERMQPYALQSEELTKMLNEYRKELDNEEHAIKQIDCMYDSEAKYNLQRCEEAWQAQHLRHYNDVKRLIDDEHFMYNTRLKDNVERQKEIIGMRETHVTAIENANEQLKKIMDDQDASKPSSAAAAATTTAAAAASRNAGAGDCAVECLEKEENSEKAERFEKTGKADKIEQQHQKSEVNSLHSQPSAQSFQPGYFGSSTHQNLDSVSDSVALQQTQSSFHNLNLDVWKDMANVRKGSQSPRVQSQRSLRTVTPDTAERPRFARKRIAWN